MANKIVRKNYKLYIEDNNTKDLVASICFDEAEGRGMEAKAHLSTIDKFTTRYCAKFDLIKALEGHQIPQSVYFDYNYGKFFIPDVSLFVTHNTTKTYVSHGDTEKKVITINEEPLYSEYEDLVKMPLKDITTCDIYSKKFKDFYEKIRCQLLSDNNFYAYIMKSDKYFGALKDSIEGLRFDCYKTNSYDSLIKNYVKGYTLYRDLYLDYDNYVKKI